MSKEQETSFVLCLKNEGYEVDLDVGTVYLALSDDKAEQRGRIRVVDESGEDYLYPRDYFTSVELSKPAKDALTTV